jgi:hypothetical protein
MRKLIIAIAVMAAMTPAALFADTRPADAQGVSADALKTAFEAGDLQVSYVQHRGRGGGGRGGVAVRGGGGRGAVAVRGAGGRGAVAVRGGAYRGGNYGRPGYAARPYYGYGGYGYNYGGAAAAGALGVATGAMVGGAIAQQQAPVYGAPAYGGGSVAYCAQRFKSYDPASGTYLGYDGLRHPCP